MHTPTADQLQQAAEQAAFTLLIVTVVVVSPLLDLGRFVLEAVCGRGSGE